MNILFIIKVKIPLFVKWPYRFCQLHCILSLEWLFWASSPISFNTSLFEICAWVGARVHGFCSAKPWPHHIQNFLILTENCCPPHLTSKIKLPLHSWRCLFTKPILSALHHQGPKSYIYVRTYIHMYAYQSN